MCQSSILLQINQNSYITYFIEMTNNNPKQRSRGYWDSVDKSTKIGKFMREINSENQTRENEEFM